MRYALPKVNRSPKEEKTWQQKMVGHWAVCDVTDSEGWTTFSKMSSIKRMLFNTVFYRMKHDVDLSDDFFKFCRYIKYPDDPVVVAKMNLYTSEEDAKNHIEDCQTNDPSDNLIKSFATYINEEEKTFTTFIDPPKSSGSRLHVTHIRKLIDDNTMSVLWRGQYSENGQMLEHIQEMPTIMERIYD
eukprot:CAMPEP_0114423034 /NCGR_PEP_ID=MMETSP0103-20121206/5931_1 /TAXON_ID=37642 ORGANISM="Paraphysomonas imperforata, Strain PA2" /NCGR_SAMPLE_ID=MMETSP0103 /ASSEMBLY_ACC=CAM_ASM_000201 /LENGTH=185 /DNA_ID=CAMNT_0001591665 /DNA_START=177 /DNA_END=734 /DNA_ORIENTATION=+